MKKVELYLSNEEWAFAEGLFQRLGYSYAVFEVESLSFSFSPTQEEVNAQAEAFEAEKTEKEAAQREESWERFTASAREIEWEEHETLENLLKDLEGEVEHKTVDDLKPFFEKAKALNWSDDESLEDLLNDID